MMAIKNTISNAEISSRTYLNNKDIATAIKNPFGKNKNETLKIARTIIKEHISTLAFKYRQSIKHSDYGSQAIDFKKWERVKNEFIKEVLLDKVNINIVQFYYDDIGREIDSAASAAEKSLGQDIKNMSPYDFEDHCADVLRSAGWKATATKRSGDQGIDVITKKKKLIVALQCKLYTGTVGNYAVQEALAGREFARATFGAVVTSSSYTNSARQLAESTGILLLHINELAKLEAKILGVIGI